MFQDVATGTDYPYLVYTFVSDRAVRRSNKAISHVRQYSVSLYTTGTANDLTLVCAVLDQGSVPYQAFVSQAGSENDDVVTNFYTYVEFEVS